MGPVAEEVNKITSESFDITVIEREIGPVIDAALNDASKVSAAIIDEGTKAQAVELGVLVKTEVQKLEKGREKRYMPLYRATEGIREMFDSRIKQGKSILKLLSAGISEYDIKKRRQEQLERERREAEARRIQEEADRKKREAEEAERKAKEAAEAEARRKKEAEQAEARRIQAEQEAKEKAEREAREAEARERDCKLKEEEAARLRHAEEAEKVGNTDKVDPILDRQTAIAGVVASPEQAPDQETLRLQKELAERDSRERAVREARESEIAEAKRVEAEKAAEKARQDAEEAAAAAAAAKAAASTAITATRADDRTRQITKWRWDFDSDGTEAGDTAAFMALVKAVVDGRAPIEYLGYDPKRPQNFRPTAINQDVQSLKGEFRCAGIRAFPQTDTQFTAKRKGE